MHHSPMPHMLIHVCRASVSALCLSLMGLPASAAVNCQAIERVAVLEAKRVDSASATQHAAGTDRVQFHQSPHLACMLPGVFILPGEAVTAHSTYEGFTLVTYTHPESQKKTSGWVQSDRLAP